MIKRMKISIKIKNVFLIFLMENLFQIWIKCMQISCNRKLIKRNLSYIIKKIKIIKKINFMKNNKKQQNKKCRKITKIKFKNIKFKKIDKIKIKIKRIKKALKIK